MSRYLGLSLGTLLTATWLAACGSAPRPDHGATVDAVADEVAPADDAAIDAPADATTADKPLPDAVPHLADAATADAEPPVDTSDGSGIDADAPVDAATADDGPTADADGIGDGDAIDAADAASPVALPPDSTNAMWTELAPMPGARTTPGAAWSGTDLYVWGGAFVVNCCATEYTLPPFSGGLLASGVRWHAATNTWTELSQAPLYPTEYPHVVWGGDRLYVYAGGLQQFIGPTPWSKDPADGAMYFPDTDEWKALPKENGPGHRDLFAIVAWTGKKLIVFGDGSFGELGCTCAKGAYPSFPFECPCPEGVNGMYDPITDKWTPIPAGPGWLGKNGVSGGHGGWTGTRLAVGHPAPAGGLAAFAAWLPEEQTWTSLPLPADTNVLALGPPVLAFPGALFYYHDLYSAGKALGWIWWDAVGKWEEVPCPPWWKFWQFQWNSPFTAWTGKYIIFWAGSGQPQGLLYDPVAHAWLNLPQTVQPLDRAYSGVVSLPGGVYVTGGSSVFGVFDDAWLFTAN